MARLVDADALHKALFAKQKWVVHYGDKHNEGYTSDQVHFAIDDAPTVDAVEVVRCKYCVYYGEHTNYIKGKFCIKHSHLNDDFVFHCDEDDFCSWGERKDEVT